MAESLLLALFENDDYTVAIAQTMKQLIERTCDGYTSHTSETSVSIDNNAIPQVLFKSSVYTSIGHSSHYLYQYLDFSSWFASRLVGELSNSSGQG